jgi:hypothetical protein
MKVRIVTSRALLTVVAMSGFALSLSCGDGNGNGGGDPTRPVLAPKAPSGLAVMSVSATRLDLSWSDNSDDESAFHIERSGGDGASWTEVAVTPSNTTSFANTGLAATTSYSYRVRAEGPGGFSLYSNTASATTQALPPPTAPSNLSAEAVSPSEISLRWQDNSTDESGFRIERSLHSATGWSEVDSVGPDITVYNDSGLNPSTDHFYRVRANGPGGYSGYSNVDVARTKDPPQVLTQIVVSPDTVLATAAGDQVQFEATALDEKGLEIEGVFFSWSSSDPSVAPVDEHGLATVLTEGLVRVSAGASGVSGDALLSVEYPDEEYQGEPVTAQTDTIGKVKFLTESFGGKVVAVSVEDERGLPVTGAEVEYAESRGKVYVVANGPAGLHVPSVFYGSPETLDSLGHGSFGTGFPSGPQPIVLGGVGEFLVVGATIGLLTWAQLRFIGGVYEIQKFYWELDQDSRSGCFSYLEIAQLMKARRQAGFALGSIGLTFVSAVAGPLLHVSSAVMLSNEILVEADLVLAEHILNVGQDHFALAKDHSVDGQKVGVYFDLVDGTSAGAKLKNIWAQYVVVPDDPLCVAPPPQPDLAAGPLTIAPASPTTSEKVTIQGSISNLGEVASQAFSWEIRVDGSVVANGRPSSLPAGATLTDQIRAVDIGPYSVGSYQVELIVDAANEIAESNKVNNRASQGFTVRTADWGPQCTASPPGGDHYESDNCPRDATRLQDPNETDDAYSEPQEHSIHVAGDRDWVKFDVTVASDINAYVQKPSGAPMRLRLYDGSGTLLSQNVSGSGNSTVSVGRTNVAAGTYFVEASVDGDNVTLASYAIRTRIKRVGTISGLADSFEPDNSQGQATRLQDPNETDDAYSEPQEHSIHVAGDRDWVKFDVTVASDINAYVQKPSGAPMRLRLYDGSGTLLSQNVSGSGNSTVSVGRTNVAAGTYFVEASVDGDNVTLASYAIRTRIKRVGTISGLADSFEPDNSQGQATRLQDPNETDDAYSEPQEHSIHVAGDRDWVKFDVTVASDINAYVQKPSGAPMRLRLYDGSGTLLSQNVSGSGNSTVSVGRTNVAAGTYFVEASVDGDNVTLASYAIRTRIKRVGTISGLADSFEPDNSQGQATRLQDPNETDDAYSEPQEHSIHVAGDRDWVKFDVTVASDINAYVQKPSGAPMRLRLYDGSGTLLSQNVSGSGNSTVSVGRTNVAAGTYFVEASVDGDNVTLASYAIRTRIKRVGTISGLADSFEPDNSQGQATRLQDPNETDDAYSEPQEHSIHVAGDRDWVKFDVTVASDINAYVQKPSGAPMRLRLYDGSGTLLSQNVSGSGNSTVSVGRTNVAAGTYFVEASVDGDNVTLASYAIRTRIKRVGTISGLADSFEPDNSQGQATRLQDPNETDDAYSEPQEHSIHVAGDRDWVKFDVTVASDINAYVQKPSGAPMRLRLYDGSGTLLSQNVSGSGNSTVSVGRTNVAAGTYFVEASVDGDNVTLASYAIRTRIKRVGTISGLADSFEPDNSQGQATRLQDPNETDDAYSEPQEHSIHVAGDRDWVKFDVTVASDINAYVQKPSGAPMRLRLYDGSGTLLSQNVSGSGNSTVSVGRTNVAAGTYFVEASVDGDNVTLASYAIRTRIKRR